MTTNEQIRHHIDEASRLAEEEVERLAREILRKHPDLDTFIMAMGCASFIDKKKRDLDLWDQSRFKPLADFIEEWDDYLGLTGCPMYFTANGPKITSW